MSAGYASLLGIAAAADPEADVLLRIFDEGRCVLGLQLQDGVFRRANLTPLAG